MHISKGFAAVLLVPVFAAVGCAGEGAEEKGVELPPATMAPIRDFPDKEGEDIAASKLGPWRWYKPNSLTYKERKTRPFWVLTKYHGGWYHDAGHQPARGGFRMANPFGVWERDPATDRLMFQFAWPFHLRCGYDPAGECYWGVNGSRVLNFTVGDDGRPDNVRVYRTDLQPYRSLQSYRFSDNQGRAWFSGGWLERDGDKVLLHPGEPERLTELSWEQAREPSKPLYRWAKYHLQKYEAGRWRDMSPPPGTSGPVRSVSQRGPAVLVATNGGAAQWYPQYGLSLQLTNEFTEWIAFDGDGRQWLSPGLCLDDTGPPTTPTQFYSSLPGVLDDDPIAASDALRCLLRAGDKYAEWVEEYTGVDDPQVKAAALVLKACLEGKRTLHFTGDRIRLERLLAGEGTAPDPLPIPEKNRDRKFVETDPLILDATAAGALAGFRLVERPILEHAGYRFRGSGKTLISPNTIRSSYLKVLYADGEIEVTPSPADHPILLASASREPDELLVLVHDAEPRRALAGVLEIETGEFKKLGELPRANYFSAELAMDADGRMILVAAKGRIVYYQNEPGGAFDKLEVKPPFMPYKGSVAYGENSRVFLYQSQYERQWEGEFSEVFEFTDGSLRRIGNIYRGHIYHMLALSDEILLAATKDPHGFLFIDNKTGELLPAPFNLTATITTRYNYLNSWGRDEQGRLWLYSTWPANNNEECGRVQLWDGETLKTVVDWCFPTEHPPLNPAGGQLCISEAGHVWVGVKERLLVIDSRTHDYRFFRAPDRLGPPSLLLANGDWVAANYGDKNTTAFHLQPCKDSK